MELEQQLLAVTTEPLAAAVMHRAEARDGASERAHGCGGGRGRGGSALRRPAPRAVAGQGGVARR